MKPSKDAVDLLTSAAVDTHSPSNMSDKPQKDSWINTEREIALSYRGQHGCDVGASALLTFPVSDILVS